MLGHSERREYFNETDRALQLKLPQALAAGLTPILCVGETEDERERGETERKLRHQVQEGLEKVPLERLPEVVVAYEPIWAIGTGRTATPEQAQEAVGFVRALVAGFDAAAAEQVRILYGGSCKPDNAAELMALPDVDGALVGGASLDPADFGAIVEIAAARRMTVPAVCLVVLDGWGLAPDGPGNAVALADTPVFDRLWAEHPHTTLTACGESVGLPAGQMGNSEVGHLNLGAGAIVPQDLARIDAAVADGSLGENETLRAALQGAERVHLIGLVSGGGVHSSERHLEALIALAAELGVPDLVIHAFTDGRDTSPTSGADSVAGIEATCREHGAGRVGSVIGRYYAMDRDGRSERTAGRARPALRGRGRAPRRRRRGGGARGVRARRDGRVHHRHDGRRGGAHPARRLACSRSTSAPTGCARSRPRSPSVVDRYTTLTQYDEDWTFPVVFPPHRPAITIGEADRRRRARSAARRRDREVPARDVLLQRRRRAALRRRGARAGALPARRADLRPQAGDERAARRRTGSCATGASRTSRSRSSTSPTPTWSATRA